MSALLCFIKIMDRAESEIRVLIQCGAASLKILHWCENIVLNPFEVNLSKVSLHIHINLDITKDIILYLR